MLVFLASESRRIGSVPDVSWQRRILFPFKCGAAPANGILIQALAIEPVNAPADLGSDPMLETTPAARSSMILWPATRSDCPAAFKRHLDRDLHRPRHIVKRLFGSVFGRPKSRRQVLPGSRWAKSLVSEKHTATQLERCW